MPDVFIPKDTASYTGYYASLLRQGLVIEYMNDLCDRNRASWIKEYVSFSKFEKNFKVTDRMKQGLIDLASERGIEYNEEMFRRSEKDLAKYMKALAASSLFERDCFYRIMNQGDPDYEEALRLATDNPAYTEAMSISQ